MADKPIPTEKLSIDTAKPKTSNSNKFKTDTSFSSFKLSIIICIPITHKIMDTIKLGLIGKIEKITFPNNCPKIGMKK